jgi:hypothetical protein
MVMVSGVSMGDMAALDFRMATFYPQRRPASALPSVTARLLV